MIGSYSIYDCVHPADVYHLTSSHSLVQFSLRCPPFKQVRARAQLLKLHKPLVTSGSQQLRHRHMPNPNTKVMQPVKTSTRQEHLVCIQCTLLHLLLSPAQPSLPTTLFVSPLGERAPGIPADMLIGKWAWLFRPGFQGARRYQNGACSTDNTTLSIADTCVSVKSQGRCGRPLRKATSCCSQSSESAWGGA